MSSYWGVEHGVSKALATASGKILTRTMRADRKAVSGVLKPLAPKPPMSVKPPVPVQRANSGTRKL